MTEEEMRLWEVLALKEKMLDEILVWLRAKGLWEECQKSLSVKITEGGQDGS